MIGPIRLITLHDINGTRLCNISAFFQLMTETSPSVLDKKECWPLIPLISRINPHPCLLVHLELDSRTGDAGGFRKILFVFVNWSFPFLFLLIAGLFTGCFVSLFSVYAILAHLSGIFMPNSERSYVETVYPVFRWLYKHYL
jgi:hypothetical protein